ncbi:MAG: hypothetical protein EHM45_07360 [Desulfobacteraceae bacterium]|nr:MAG: hypothetical protein EHM45_07360 [Desulfobacteraceae bacterium]
MTTRKKDYYLILGISKDADESAIKAAYRKLALRHHPDTNLEDPEALERIKEINEAYEVLSDNNKRNQYDLGVNDRSRSFYSRHSPVDPYAEETVFFKGFRCRGRGFGRGCGGGFGRGFGGMQRFFRGAGVHPLDSEPHSFEQPIHDFPLTAAEARLGAERDIRLHVGQGTRISTVSIPPGIQDGAVLSVKYPVENGQSIELLLRAKITD